MKTNPAIAVKLYVLTPQFLPPVKAVIELEVSVNVAAPSLANTARGGSQGKIWGSFCQCIAHRHLLNWKPNISIFLMTMTMCQTPIYGFY